MSEACGAHQGRAPQARSNRRPAPRGGKEVRRLINLARATLDQASVRPDLRVGTVDDQVELADAVALAAGRATQLLDGGLRPAHRVALVAPTSTDYIVTWLACLLAGTPVALVNPAYPGELVERMLAPLAPDVVLGLLWEQANNPEVALGHGVGPGRRGVAPT